MSITFPCGECGQKYQVPQDLAGKRMKCRKCGAIQQVPTPRPRPSAPALPEVGSPFLDVAPSNRPSVRQRPNGSAPAFDPFAQDDSPTRPAAANPYADLYDLDESKPDQAGPLIDHDEDVLPAIGRPGVRPGGGSKRKSKSGGLDPKVMLITVGSIAGVFLLLALVGLFSKPAAFLLMGLGILIGFVMMITGNIWQLVNAFRESALCGILYFVPVVNYIWPLYYLITRWEAQKRPFALGLGGFLVLLVVGGIGFAEAGRLGAFDEGRGNPAADPAMPFGPPGAVLPPGFPGAQPQPQPMPIPQPNFPQPPAQPNFPGQPPAPAAPPAFQPGGGFAGGGQAPRESKPEAPRFTPGGGFASGEPAGKGKPAVSGFGSGPTLWKVQADPPAEAVDLSGVKDFNVAIPARFDHRNVVFPTAPSRFVVVGRNDNDKEARELWDLTTGKAVARIRGKAEIEKPLALSANGAYLAGNVPWKNAVVVVDLKANKELGRFEFPQHKPDAIDFAGNDRLVLGFFWGNQIQVWDLKTGQQTANVTVKRFEKEAFAVSPGGRFVAAIFDHVLHVYDAENGAEVGLQTLPRGMDNAETNGKGLAFSPDGQELVALAEAWGKWYITCWNLSDGKVIAHHGPFDKGEVKQPGGFEGLPSIQWLPHQDGWLVFGEAIVEKQSGKKVESLPYGDELKVAARKIINDDRALAVVGKDGQRLVAVPLQTEKIAAATRIAREGGDPLDATLGGTKSADLTSARAISLGRTAWSASADPAPSVASGISSRLTTIKTRPGEVAKILFASPDVPRAAISSQPEKAFPHQPASLDGKPLVIDRFDISNGKHLGRIELPPAIDLVAFSPDGKTVLTGNYKDHDRLDAFDKSGKPIAGWRPYGQESGDDRQVVWADFLDADRVLTASATGTVVLWSLPDCKPEYVIKNACQGPPRLSPGRKSLALFQNSAFTLIDPAAGSAQGTTAALASAPGRVGAFVSCFSQDGRVLAAVVGSTLARWDLTTGQTLGEFPVAVGEVKSIELCGPNHALVNGQTLYDLNRRKVVWYYQGGAAASGSPDGLHWLALGNPFQPARLGALQVPDPAIEKLVAQSEDPSIPAVLKPGTTVSVQLDFGNPPRDADAYRKKLTEALANRIRVAGATAKDNQAVKLVAKITEKSTNETMQLRQFGIPRAGGPGVTTIPIRNLECELFLSDAQGPIPIARQTIHMQQFGMVRLPSGEGDVSGYLFHQVWMGAQNWFGGVGLPSYVARGPSGVIQLPGNTDLNQLVK